MPELAEVEAARARWMAGVRQKVLRVFVHPGKRVFRGTDPHRLRVRLQGARLLAGWAHGKQMLFRFSNGGWLGIHLGMSGELLVEGGDFTPGKHDHLALQGRMNTLVYRDPRMFGRVRFDEDDAPPAWWTKLPPAIASEAFTLKRIGESMQRRSRLTVKAALLVQSMFPGVGNWMADEILWRARIAPRTLCGRLSSARVQRLWRATREVCEGSLRTVGVGQDAPPRGWLFHERWRANGSCPRDGSALARAEVGGRTTRWCRRCQR